MNNVFSLKVPKGWKSVPMWTISTRKDRKGYPEAELLSVYREYGVIRKIDRDDNHNVESDDLSGYKFVKQGDLVLNKMKTWQGSLGVSPYEGIVSPAYFICELSRNVYGPFIHYLLRSQPYIAMYGAASKGIRVGQWDLPYDEFKKLPVLLPSMEEQHKIAAYLDEQIDTLNTVINAKLQVHKLLTIASQAEFTKIFGHPYFSSENKTESRRLGPCLLANDGGVWGDEPLGSGNSLVLRSTEISQRGYWRDLESAAHRKLDDKEERLSRLKVDDIVVTKASGSPDHIGKAAITTQEVADLNASFGNFMQRIRVNPNIYLPAYLHYFLKSYSARSQFNFLGTTSTGLMNVSAEVLSNLRLPIVSLRDQQETVSLLKKIEEDFESKLGLVDQSIAVCNEYKSSLITAAVTGRNDLFIGRDMAS